MTTRSCKVDQTELYKVKRIIKKIKKKGSWIHLIGLFRSKIKDKYKKKRLWFKSYVIYWMYFEKWKGQCLLYLLKIKLVDIRFIWFKVHCIYGSNVKWANLINAVQKESFMVIGATMLFKRIMREGSIHQWSNSCICHTFIPLLVCYIIFLFDSIVIR